MKKTKVINEVVKKLVSTMITQDSEEWPPSCLAILYQPVRPFRSKERNTEDQSVNDSHPL